MNQNKVTINSSKAYALIISPTLAVNPLSIIISLNSSRIEVTDCINYLDLLVDSKLFLNDHIYMISFELSKAVGIIS